MRAVRSLTRHTTKRPAFAPRQAAKLTQAGAPARTKHRPSASGVFPGFACGLTFLVLCIAEHRGDFQGRRPGSPRVRKAMSLNFKRISLSLNTTKLSEHPP